LFNGKELDEETGLYYYGARYYDARTSVWQSVDPMAEKFGGMTKKWFNDLWNNVSDKMQKNAAKMAMVESGQISGGKMNRLSKQISKLQSKNQELGQIANEIIALENSDQMYNVVVSDKFSDSSVDKAGTIYNQQTGEVDIV